MISSYSVVKKHHLYWQCQVNNTTLVSIHPKDYRYFSHSTWWYDYTSGGIETDFVAVFRRKNSATAVDWWFFLWDRCTFNKVHWGALVLEQQMTVVRTFLERELKGVRPWGSELEVMVTLEGL